MGQCFVCDKALRGKSSCDCVETLKKEWNVEKFAILVSKDTQLTYRKTNEWRGPCPIHKGKDANFQVWLYKGEPAYRCNSSCDHSQNFGDVFRYLEVKHGKDFIKACRYLMGLPEVIEHKQHRATQREVNQKQVPLSIDLVQQYHELLDTTTPQGTTARDWWHMQGLDDRTIELFELGYTTQCPIYRRSPSFTIPVLQAGRVLDIRHRLLDPKDNKYLPHGTGRGLHLFNTDSIDLYPNGRQRAKLDAAIFFGEKKVAVHVRYGLSFFMPAVSSTGGSKSWLGDYAKLWVPLFDDFQRIYICPDPGELDDAVRTARLFGRRGCVIEPIDNLKPDDLLVQQGDEGFKRFMHELENAKPWGTTSYWQKHLSIPHNQVRGI